jgi:hypothetical protein
MKEREALEVNRDKRLCLSLVLAALAVGALIGWMYRGANTVQMMVYQGKAYPSPINGQVLHWNTTVMWVGPPGYKSPCAEDENTSSPTCTVKIKPLRSGNQPTLKMYHYICADNSCPDPTVPAPYSTGGHGTGTIGLGSPGSGVPGSGTSGSAVGALAGGGKSYSAEADPNGGTSGVWYFASNTNVPPSGFYPISVVTAGGEVDQVTWEPAGASWKVVVNAGTCQEGTTTFPDVKGNGTCTIMSGATSQNYCVAYDDYTPGTAQLIVNGNTTTLQPAPTCRLP